MQTVTLSLFRFPTLAARLWVLGMMGWGRLVLRRTPGLSFWKLCGSGTDQGFTPVPNTEVWAILGVWTDAATARAAISDHRLWRACRRRASEDWTLYLNPLSARGAWAGVHPFRPEATDASGPLAALTRAAIRPRIASRFWARVPDISRRIGENRDVLFKVGIGELPLLNQVTFSVWPDAESMARFARTSGPHAEAIRAVREGRWFREELYARFRVAGESGSWEGRLAPRLTKDRPA